MADEASTYLYERRIPELFESMMAALMYVKPEDHLAFLQQCLAKAASSPGGEITLDSFISCKNALDVESKVADGPVATSSYSTPDPQPEKRYSKDILRASADTVGEDRQDNAEEMTDDQKLKELVTSRPLVFVLGGPGSGKGTHCDRIVKEFGFTHMSAGDLLRAEVAKGTAQGVQLQEIMREGNLVPAEVTIGLLRSAILSRPESSGFLIDGFPRELTQAELFKEQVCECERVLVFECSEEVMVKRLLSRGATSGRVDDNEGTIRKRLHTYWELTVPVIQHYQNLGRVVQIDSDRRVDEVYSDVQEMFSTLIDTRSSVATDHLLTLNRQE